MSLGESPLLLLGVRVDTVDLDDRRTLSEIGGDDDLKVMFNQRNVTTAVYNEYVRAQSALHGSPGSCVLQQ